ncbi:MAG: N-6 DNA methylase [Cyanobacteria bacterium MAG CAR3_bin_5]|nr:N-6 DNA methylase [Cyanobacteria bacterium MAG CAR3_bin_5]MCY4236011.1 N-6 DNA methylase [Cyanobacteria bacterium MAG CAR2_bin_4]
MTLQKAVSIFGRDAKLKLSNPGASGAPEDQLRAPLEALMASLAELTGLRPDSVVMVGETSLAGLKTRPDYAVTHNNVLIGFIEVKAPGKGADPRKFREQHDKDQWAKLRTLPNLIYTDGNGFSLWRNGERQGTVVQLTGDIETAGNRLAAPDEKLLSLFIDFFQWEPQPPRSAKELAETTARLCRLLREEVTEQLEQGSTSLTNLATDSRRLLFPGATDKAFADGYAQAVTFGLLMARAQDISLADGLDRVAYTLRKTNTLIGTALRLLTDDADNEKPTLKTSLATLTRVLDTVHWPAISKGDQEAWLYFYEDFLSIYDNDLRKKTGSYYTPVQVVRAMVRLVDEALQSDTRFGLPEGLASPDVTVADPAIGTGAYLLAVFRRIAETTAADQGAGAVPGVIEAAVSRLIGFEIQFGPFAVAQLRILAELQSLLGSPNATPNMQLFITDILGNPYDDDEYIPQILRPLGESRIRANEIKRQERITVVIGNPPYKEKARGRGGWIEGGTKNSKTAAPLSEWIPPTDWNLSHHIKHLRNLYIYFWRWATWKVFGDGSPSSVKSHGPDRKGIVSFITVAGFLNGPGFQKMRAELRQGADEIWVIDCSPEGHQPEVATRVFQGVQQPVCIVMALRSTDGSSRNKLARVRYRALPQGHRDKKFAALGMIALDDDGWQECPAAPRAPFFPKSDGAWADFAALENLFNYNGSGVMPGRIWVISPDRASLEQRWKTLQAETDLEKKENLFRPHLRNGSPGDKHINKRLSKGLHGHEFRPGPVALDTREVIPPVRYGYRSFDRQWIIPDGRLINQPNPKLWCIHSNHQIYMTALQSNRPTAGPAVTFCAVIPDLSHYKGSFGGRVFPLWSDRDGQTPNLKASLLQQVSEALGVSISTPDMMAYFAAAAAHPGYTERFQANLVQPGLRFPLTGNASLFAEAVQVGQEIIWLHCFGERFVDRNAGRPKAAPRMPEGKRPIIPRTGAIPTQSDRFPDCMTYDETACRLRIGDGFIDNVPSSVWEYEISGKRVLVQWFSYRRLDRSRPRLGDRRLPSLLASIQPHGWLSEYTTELMNVLNILGRLVALEPRQADLLNRICDGPMINLRTNGAFDISSKIYSIDTDEQQPSFIPEDNNAQGR